MRTAILAAACCPPRRWPFRCNTTAPEPPSANGERVEVIHYYDASAKREGQSTNWDPPARVDGAPGDGAPDLALTLFFAEPNSRWSRRGSSSVIFMGEL